MKKVSSVLVVCIWIFFSAAPLVSAENRFSRVKNLTAEFQPNAERLHVDWDPVTGARKYKVRIYRGTTLMKEVENDKNKRNFSESLFSSEKTYKIKVRVKKTANKKASDWRTVSYTHYPIPTISTTEAQALSNSTNWLHVVDDGQEQLVASTEFGGKIYMARFDPENPSATLSWTLVFDTSYTGGQSIADHWHIYAHDFHWIVFSVTSANRSFLGKINSDFELVEITQVADPDMQGIFTNDMFMVEDGDGIAIGHFNGELLGHRIFRYTTDLDVLEEVDIGGDEYAHKNGSSVIPVDDGFDLLASDTLNPEVESSIQLIHLNQDWEEESVTSLIDVANFNYAMPSGVYVPGGYLVVNAREIDLSEGGGESGDDSGNVVQYVFGPDLEQVSQRTVVDGLNNRPHLVLSGTQLVSSWDGGGSGYVQVDSFEFE